MKKAQIQYMETIFVLLILVVIIFIGTIVVYSFYSKSLNEKRQDITNIDSVTLTTSIINMPELTCGKNTNCIDALKILAFQETLQSNPYYKILFRNMDISIEIIYPKISLSSDVPCTKDKFNSADSANRQFPVNCNTFIIYESQSTSTTQEIIQSPVQVYFPSVDKKALGVLNIIRR